MKKNYFEILGVTPEDSVDTIKKAYKKQALKYHPDRAKNEAEKLVFDRKMKLLNEAKEVLCDNEKKQKYTVGLEFFEEKYSFLKPYIPMLGPGMTAPFSAEYRKRHQSLVSSFIQNPLQKRNAAKIAPYRSHIYIKAPHTYADIFSFIQARQKDPVTDCDINPHKIITPIIATKLFMHFLSGKYYGTNLTHLKKYLSNQIARMTQDSTEFFRKSYYKSICDIVFMTEEKPSKKLLVLLEKIASFVQKLPEYERIKVLALFHNKYYRNLHAFALHMQLHAASVTLDSVDGYEEAKHFMEEKKEKFLANPEDESLLSGVRLARVLMDFERDLQRSAKPEKTAQDYRDRAFHFIDWIPSIAETTGKAMLHNIILQIACTFQQASQAEFRPALKMADEKMALNLYLEAVSMHENLTPNAESYIFTKVVANLHQLHYALPDIEAIQEALERRLFVLTNIFPFVEPSQSNTSWLLEKNSTLPVMRELLHALNALLEQALKPDPQRKNPINLPHSASTILYQSYEACLKNWYEDIYNPDLEQKFRLELMTALLAEKNTGFETIHKNLLSPFIMVHRDKNGFLHFPGTCAFAENSKFPVYRGIHGLEVNHNTGEIIFFLDEWQTHYRPWEKRFNSYDFIQLIEKNIQAAFFSLDPVDPDKPYHPFNAMRFSKSIHDTELFHVMLLTDYILKFMTTGQEVSGIHPFIVRKASKMIESLPEYLRKIIEDYQKTATHGAIRRFWIDAESIDVIEDEDELKNNNCTRIALGDITMVVRTREMERDYNGDLKDKDGDKEGWPIYVLTRQQMQALIHRKRVIDGSAMIFIYGEAQLYYWKDNAILQSVKPVNSRENLIRLYKLEKDTQGKIPVITKNMPLLYRLTTTMAAQSGLSHQYSPEFIFAYQITRHYDEISQYIPEFGRLKELSKILIVIRELNQIRAGNNHEKIALNAVLSQKRVEPEIQKIHAFYKEQFDKNYANVYKELTRLRNLISTSSLEKQWQQRLAEIRTDMGTLNFNERSPEVHEIANKMYADLARKNPYINAQRLWQEISYTDIATQLSKQKWDSCENQLYNAFKDRLHHLTEERCRNIIRYFLNGYPDLENELVAAERSEQVRNISQQFPYQNEKIISEALDDTDYYTAGYKADCVAKAEATRPIQDLYSAKARVEAGFFAINLGKNTPSVDLENQTFWVPASIRHEIKKDDHSGQTRFSFFAYGGVDLQTKTNYLYQKVGPDGEHLKFGITANPTRRYTAAQLDGGRLRIVAQGTRAEMLKLERNCHTYLPIGPQERQSQYVKIQAAMGYKTPPYF